MSTSTALQTGVRVSPRLLAVATAAKHHNLDLDPGTYQGGYEAPSPAALAEWARNQGLWSKAVRLTWSSLIKLPCPVVLLLQYDQDMGAAAVMIESDPKNGTVTIIDPAEPSEKPWQVDELRMQQAWGGDVILLRSERSIGGVDPQFSLQWLMALVLTERTSLRDICAATLVISCLTIFPPLVVMTVVDKVLTHHSYSTLAVMSLLWVIATAFESLLGWGRRIVVVTVGTRLDAQLNLHVFTRLLRLPLDYFERHPAGETTHKVGQVYKIRDFMTGKMLTALLDMTTLVVILPFLFFLSPLLAMLVLACSASIALIIYIFVKPLRSVYGRVVRSETEKVSALVETISGMRTVKSLALEPQRKSLWDDWVAEVGKARLAFGKTGNWPQSLVTPFERFMSIGVTLFGAYLALNGTAYAVGSLFAFMMLAQRISQPLVGAAKLIEDYEEVMSAVGEAASVLNRPLEPDSSIGGLRPNFRGQIVFDQVSFTYPDTKVPALNNLSFSVSEGTMLGIVGRSGSGKSTITRLLQGINRDYSGFLKIDGADLREINLRHLRQSFGVVLQDNFLFRGSIRENIISGRPGLTLEDVVRAARLAGAEEFIERMPNGYETFIQEGSPNLSGGQRQRLAIARALIMDPRLLILDEATSALDPESEALVNSNLMRIARDRTMVIVSHRLSSLTECDQILVLEKGQAVDIEQHHVLLQRCQLYSGLWHQQSRGGPKPRVVPADVHKLSASLVVGP